MTVKDYIEEFNESYDNSIFNAEIILKWINIVEASIDVMPEYRARYIQREMNIGAYDMPEDVSFEDIYAIWVEGIKYSKKDVREHKRVRTFWREDDKLCIFPVPIINDKEDSPQIKVVYRYRPKKKLLEDISTDTLYIPDRFIDIYDYFLLAKIAYTQKEYTDHNNHTLMYNTRVDDLERWWEENRPQNPMSDIVPDGGY